MIVWLLLALHVGVVLVLAVGAGKITSRHVVFGLTAIPAGCSAVFAAIRLGADSPLTTSVTWVEQLDLRIAFRVDELSALLALIVSGVGVLVFVYAMGYFGPSASGVAKFGATLLAFSTAMVGLVLADSVWTLFVFWELTSITSFLLVGHKHADPATRAAARRALLITAAGGLVLLAGLLVVTSATIDGGSGDTGLRALGPVGGTAGAVGAVLILVAAATKSAQVPFHV
ncbi:MAG: proton-conducting transporter membrane subunit, partial [Actinomycetota bacterium]